MRGSIKLFRLFGIFIKIHITFLILPLLGFFWGGIRGVCLILFIFLCVVLHEICHSLQAKKYGVIVDEIILLPIGGIASMRNIPDNPSQEFAISIMGPLFNFALAIVFYYPLRLLLGPDVLHQFPPSISTWPNTIAYAFWINPLLGAFNLLPAFPMDGGRILRAFLARRIDYQRATRIAVGFGHAFALVFAFAGIMSGNFILIIIALFVYMAASQEELRVDLRMTLRKFYVKDILPEQFLSIEPDTPLSKVLEFIFHSHQEDFPVTEGGRLVGLLTRADIISTIHQFGLNKKVGEVMRRDFLTAKPDDLLTNVHKMMEESGLKAIPILREGSLCGIIALEDISKVYMVMSARK